MTTWYLKSLPILVVAGNCDDDDDCSCCYCYYIIIIRSGLKVLLIGFLFVFHTEAVFHLLQTSSSSFTPTSSPSLSVMYQRFLPLVECLTAVFSVEQGKVGNNGVLCLSHFPLLFYI